MCLHVPGLHPAHYEVPENRVGSWRTFIWMGVTAGGHLGLPDWGISRQFNVSPLNQHQCSFWP